MAATKNNATFTLFAKRNLVELGVFAQITALGLLLVLFVGRTDMYTPVSASYAKSHVKRRNSSLWLLEAFVVINFFLKLSPKTKLSLPSIITN